MGVTMQTTSDDLGLTTDMFQAGAAGGAMAGTMATSDGHRWGHIKMKGRGESA